MDGRPPPWVAQATGSYECAPSDCGSACRSVTHVRRSRATYALLFQLPLLPELALRAGNFALLRRFLAGSAHPGNFSPADVARHVTAWARPGALTAMLNYYRAVRHKPGGPARRIAPPTLLIWGAREVFLVDTATYWVQREAADAVNDALAREEAGEGDTP